MFNVVFPTNFSSTNQKRVIEFIQQFTPSANPAINYYAVHAYRTPKVGQSIMLDMDEELEKNATEDMDTYLGEITKNIAEGIDITPFIQQGSFETVLHKFDKKINLNLVVLIETKDSTFQEVLSEKSLSLLSSSLGEPILFIPTDPEYIIPKKITFATDLDPFENDEDFKNFLDFVKISNSELEFLHIAEKEEDHFKKYEEVFGEILKEYKMEYVPLTLVNDTNVEQSIIKYIETEKPEMIALIERGETFYQRWFQTQTVDVLSKYNRLPVFVIHESIDQTQRKEKK